MCDSQFNSSSFVHLNALLNFELVLEGLTAKMVVTSESGVATIPVPKVPDPPLALKIMDQQLHFGSVSPGDCQLMERDIPLLMPLDTFRVLAHGDGIGISDLRDGRVRIVSIHLADTFVLLNVSIVAGLVILNIKYMEHSEHNMLTYAEFEQEK